VWTHPTGRFSEDYISAPRGALVPQIFTRARHWPRLASAIQKPGRGSPPPKKIFKGEHLKLGLKFHICAPITLGVVGITSRNFTRGVAHSRGDNVVTNFARGAPYKIWEGKKRPKFSALCNNFRL